MTQRERLVDLLEANWSVFSHVDCELLAGYLLDNGVRRVVRCYECEYLGIKGLTDGYCKKDIMGLVSPNDYCSRGKPKEKKQ